jgi:hypothetical protein
VGVRVGHTVEVRAGVETARAGKGGKLWLTARLEGKNPDGTYNVRYLKDGRRERDLPPARVRAVGLPQVSGPLWYRSWLRLW